MAAIPLMKHGAAFILCVALAAAALSSMKCKDDGVTPPDDKPDTTSHDFTWTIETMGDGASSALYDVAIINDTLAYAVGEIYKRDSSGNWDPNAYNFARWNGRKWELLRIQFYTVCGQSSHTPYPASSLFAFSENDIRIAMNGDQVARWDGSKQTTTICLPVSFSVKKVWGEDSNSVYLVGDGGNILHYFNGTWQKLESGTNLPFLDIYGATDSKTGEQQILALCSQNIPHERGLYRLQGNTATELSTYPLQYDLSSVWFVPNKHYYLVGSGMFEKDLLSENEWKKGEPGVVKYGLARIRGNGLNDVFAVGSFGEVLHYNGASWQSFLENTGVYGGYGSVAVKGNLVIAVGNDSPLAAVAVGRRNK